MAIGHLPRTTVCLLPHSHLVRETDHLFLLRAENFPDVSGELPCTSHWLKLDLSPPLNRSLVKGKYYVLIGLGPDS